MKSNCADVVTIETEGEGRLATDMSCVMLPEIAALMSGVRFDVNRTLCSSGLPPLGHAAFVGHEASVRMLLEDIPGVNVNQPDSVNGATPLHAAAYKCQDACVRLLLDAPGINVNQPESTDGLTPLRVAACKGQDACVRLLLDAPGINVNQPDSTQGATPLCAAASNGHETCLRLLLDAPGINVNHVDKNGLNVLICAFEHVMTSLRQVGSGDTTRILVRLLASRKVSSQALAYTISRLQRQWLTNAQVAEIENSGQALTNVQEVVRLLLPVLRAQSTGERRWCGWCWALTPDRNLPMCTRCREYGYCCDAEGESNMVCQKKHWKAGGHRAECATLAGVGAVAAVEEATEGDGAGMAEGKGDEANGGASVGVVDCSDGGDGGGGKKKKGGKKGKKGRR